MKTYFIAILFLTITLSGFAQNTYFRLNAGYSIPFVKSVVDESYSIRYEYAFDRIIEDFSSRSTSFGKGIMIQALLGFKMKEDLTFEAGINYFNNKDIVYTSSVIYYNGSDIDKYSHSIRMVSITPSLVLAHPFKYFETYIGIGPSICFPKGIDSYTYSSYTGDRKSATIEYLEKSITLGLHSKIGFNYPINKSFAFNMELMGSAVVFQPDKSEVTSYYVNGHESLETLTTYEKQTTYEDDYSIQYIIDYNGDLVEAIDPDKPKVTGKFNIPLSSITIFAGFKYNF